MATDLQTEIVRFFIISFPEVFFSLLAAFIVLRKKVKGNWLKFLIVSLLISVNTIITYNYVRIVILDSMLYILLSFVLLKYLFKFKTSSLIGIVVLFTIFAIISETLGTLLSVYLFHVSIPKLMTDKIIWLKAFLPAFILNIVIAYTIRPIGQFILPFLGRINFTNKASYFRPLLLSIILQFFLLTTIMGQFMLHTTDSNGLYIVFINFFLLIGLNIYILLKSSIVTEKKIVAQNQETISENMMDLVNTVRSQRHDFVNNLQVINSFIYKKDFDNLNQYVSKLNHEVSVYNDILKLDQPIISALLNSKVTQAELKGIKVDMDIQANLSSLTTKAYDIARILGNLLDNAIDTILDNEQEKRWIKLSISKKGPLLIFSITNPGELAEETKEHLFTAGFTTKDNKHSGLGLYISEQLAKKLHGQIEFANSEEGVRFSLAIPRI